MKPFLLKESKGEIYNTDTTSSEGESEFSASTLEYTKFDVGSPFSDDTSLGSNDAIMKSTSADKNQTPRVTQNLNNGQKPLGENRKSMVNRQLRSRWLGGGKHSSA